MDLIHKLSRSLNDRKWLDGLGDGWVAGWQVDGELWRWRVGGEVWHELVARVALNTKKGS
jgi:hypothetical protein